MEFIVAHYVKNVFTNNKNKKFREIYIKSRRIPKFFFMDLYFLTLKNSCIYPQKSSSLRSFHSF